MKTSRLKIFLLLMPIVLLLFACGETPKADRAESIGVEKQQAVYNDKQPAPFF